VAMERAGRKVAGGLARYVSAAVLVRGVDSGAGVGLVLLALDPGLHIRNGAATGGLLAAALSAPHLVGPWLAHRLDRSPDSRRLLAAAYLLYACALAIGSMVVGRMPLVVALLAVAAAGCCGPLLTGGLSSRLAGIRGSDDRAQRRAQGWDALTYGVGGTAGPAVVAGVAASLGPLAALLGLSAAAIVAAMLTLTLPPDHSDRSAATPTPGIRVGMSLLVTRAPLRRVTVMTMLGALGLGALPVIAAVLGPHLTDRPGAGATLTVAYGLGNLAGSLLVTILPLRGEPDVLALRLFAALATATAICAFAPSFPSALAGFALIGIANSTSFTATLAARSAYAPPTARAQVFVTSAGLKIALASVGAATAGAAAGIGGHVLLLISAAITATAVLTAAADRVITPRQTGRAVKDKATTTPGSTVLCTGEAAAGLRNFRGAGRAPACRRQSSRDQPAKMLRHPL
jgi:MFS family permease